MCFMEMDGPGQFKLVLNGHTHTHTRTHTHTYAKNHRCFASCYVCVTRSGSLCVFSSTSRAILPGKKTTHLLNGDSAHYNIRVPKIHSESHSGLPPSSKSIHTGRWVATSHVNNGVFAHTTGAIAPLLSPTRGSCRCCHQQSLYLWGQQYPRAMERERDLHTMLEVLVQRQCVLGCGVENSLNKFFFFPKKKKKHCRWQLPRHKPTTAYHFQKTCPLIFASVLLRVWVKCPK